MSVRRGGAGLLTSGPGAECSVVGARGTVESLEEP
jgi:hypothetical protein